MVIPVKVVKVNYIGDYRHAIFGNSLVKAFSLTANVTYIATVKAL